MDLLLFTTILFNLFLIVDPIGCLPLFLTITKSNTVKQRRRMIIRASIIAFVVLVFFAILGHPILDYFGIGTPALKIAGGALLFIIGIEMLYGRVSKTESSELEEREAIKKQDISITPLAIPLLAGPGAISAVMLFSGTAESSIGLLYVVGAIFTVMILSLIILLFSEVLLRILGQIGITVIARVMGLLLIFMATQFVIDGLTLLGITS